MVASILPLEVRDVVLKRRGRRILGPVSLTLEGEGFTIVMGPNGSGKTSLLRAMHGLERLSGGSIRWSAPIEETRARQAFVFQSPILLRRSVVDNIAYPLVLDGVARKAARAMAAGLGEEVGLGGLLDQSALDLSGGERQKLALARALIRKPEVLFLDEPRSPLDARDRGDPASDAGGRHPHRDVDARRRPGAAAGKRHPFPSRRQDCRKRSA